MLKRCDGMRNFHGSKISQLMDIINYGRRKTFQSYALIHLDNFKFEAKLDGKHRLLKRAGRPLTHKEQHQLRQWYIEKNGGDKYDRRTEEPTKPPILV